MIKGTKFVQIKSLVKFLKQIFLNLIFLFAKKSLILFIYIIKFENNHSVIKKVKLSFFE